MGEPSPTAPPPVPPGDTAFLAMLVDFVDELRAAGLPVGTGDLLTFGAAMKPLDPTDMTDLYWAGHACLVTRPSQIAVYDRVFRRFFLDGPADDEPHPARRAMRARESSSVLEVPAAEPDPDSHEPDEDPTTLGLMAADAEVLRDKAFGACTEEELAAVRRMMARLRISPPRHRTRRTIPASTGHRPDLRRTVRETLRAHGEPSELFWRRRRERPRPLVLLLDVSGSMADHSRAMLQFAWSARRAHTKVEVFCFGTRLTRITRELDRRRPDEAMARAAAAVVDWDGGTRIGRSIDTFVRDWGRDGTCRRGIVVVCSDGLDRGDPAVLDGAMARLARLARRIVWMHPQATDGAFTPSTLGMMVVAPHVDEIVSGADLRSLERFAAHLPALG